MSCDAELQELMIQVDRMVEEKRMEWQEKIKNTENKLNSTLQDNYNLKTIIEEKNNEIANIKNRMKYTDNISNIFDYDQQVLELRLELSQIKKSYEKYYHKYTKKTKEIEKEKEELCKEKINLLKEINELRSSQKKYQEEISTYQEHIKEFELKRNTFLIEREALNEQIKLMKTEFNDQLSNYADDERKYSQNLKDLENKLSESKFALQNEIDESKSKLCESLQQVKKTMDEKQQLVIDNDSAKRMIMRLENELSRMSTENKIKEKTICKMQQIINVSEKTINEKNEVLRALQVNSASKDYAGTVSKLESDLLDAKSNVKSSKKNEKSLQIEIQILQKRFKDAQEVIENEKIERGNLEASLKRLSVAENEKLNLLDQMKNMELIIENKKTEITNLKSKLERVEMTNEELISNQLRKETEKQVNNNDNTKNRPDNRRKSEEECFMQSAESLLKERNYLLKFCEDKDLIIHRLQLENRILQDFISKLNSGLSNEVPYMNSDLNEDNGLSMLDNYHVLKETFTDYEAPEMNIDKQTENHNHNNPVASSKSSSSKHAAEYLTNSTDSFSNLNFYHSHESFSETINKSSEDFLTRLMLSNPADHLITDEQESYLKVYPTLAAAKYFTDEREKTRQIERQIDLHMNQLKKKTETKHYQ